MGNYLDGYEMSTCLHCNKDRTKEGHDGCIGTLKGVMNACCGHGEVKSAYVQFDHDDYKQNPNKFLINGGDALIYIEQNK